MYEPKRQLYPWMQGERGDCLTSLHGGSHGLMSALARGPAVEHPSPFQSLAEQHRTQKIFIIPIFNSSY